MENENNNMNQNNSDSTYHYGRNESPFGKENISGEVDMNDSSTKEQTTEAPKSEYQTNGTNPYSQGNVYGQGIYTGNDFGKQRRQRNHRMAN